MNIEKKNVKGLLPADYNPRKDLKPGDAEYEKLKRSIEQFGYVEPVIWNKATGRVVGGHQRLKVLIDMGITEVECVVVELDEEKEKALNIALNKISGDWDKDKLALLIADLQGADFDVSLTGFEPAEIDALFKDTLKDGVKEDDFDVDAELQKVYESLIKLCTDICQRNGKKKLLWFADKTKTLNYAPKADEMVLTVHRWFANKSCPGDWLYSRLGDLASKVTAALGGTSTTTTPSTGTETKVLYRIRKTWADAKSQKGAYTVLANAKKCADANPGYSVFDSNGTLVYPVSYRVHTVVHGDTLWKIAAQYLGDGSRYKEIVSLNGLTSNVICSGQKLKIPN